MRNYYTLLFALIFALSALLPARSSEAARIVVEVGDRPYYTHGPWYRHHGHKWCWVGGHWNWNHTHWIKGHYRRC